MVVLLTPQAAVAAAVGSPAAGQAAVEAVEVAVEVEAAVGRAVRSGEWCDKAGAPTGCETGRRRRGCCDIVMNDLMMELCRPPLCVVLDTRQRQSCARPTVKDLSRGSHTCRPCTAANLNMTAAFQV